jgi:hypothetical protein
MSANNHIYDVYNRVARRFTYFHTKNPTSGIIWKALEWKLLVYFTVIIFIWYLFGIHTYLFHGHYFYWVFIWYLFGIFGQLE